MDNTPREETTTPLDMAGEKAKSRPYPATHETLVRAYPRVGRNAPCPCGSQKKYKHCHMREAERLYYQIKGGVRQ